MNVSAAAEKIATYMIDSADRLNEVSMLSLAIILQPYLKGVQVFLNNPWINQFVNAEDIRSTELGSVVFEYVKNLMRFCKYGIAIQLFILKKNAY